MLNFRDCGDCTSCCYTMEIDDLIEPSPQDCWCPHVRNGGCSVYKERPDSCVAFNCSWRTGHLPDDLKPNRVGDAVAVTWFDDGEYRIYSLHGKVTAGSLPLFVWLFGQMRGGKVGISFGSRSGETVSGVLGLPGKSLTVIPNALMDKYGMDFSSDDNGNFQEQFKQWAYGARLRFGIERVLELCPALNSARLLKRWKNRRRNLRKKLKKRK